MKPRRITRLLAGCLMALAVLTPISAAQVQVNGSTLAPEEGWVEDGRSYVTLNALCRASTGYRLSWDGKRAKLSGNGATLTAKVGLPYIEVNGRALYLPDGPALENGRLALPLRLLENALGGAVSWDGDSATASLSLKNARAEQADYPEEDLYWLSRIIAAESRGEPLTGQIAVGNVVLNRVKSGLYPDTVREVIFDEKDGIQFEPVGNGSVYNTPDEASVLAAKLALEGADTVGACMYFFAPALSPGTWIVEHCTYQTTIGGHRFYTQGETQ